MERWLGTAIVFLSIMNSLIFFKHGSLVSFTSAVLHSAHCSPNGSEIIKNDMQSDQRVIMNLITFAKRTIWLDCGVKLLDHPEYLNHARRVWKKGPFPTLHTIHHKSSRYMYRVQWKCCIVRNRTGVTAFLAQISGTTSAYRSNPFEPTNNIIRLLSIRQRLPDTFPTVIIGVESYIL